MKYRLLLFYTIIMIFQLECEAMKSRFYTTTSDDQLSGWTEKKTPKYFPKPNLCQKKVMVTVRWSAAHLIHHSFLNSRETITYEMYAQWVDEVHQKLQGLQQALIKSSVQSLSHVQLSMTPWTAARQASLFITNSQSLLKLMSIESVMPSNHLILCCPLLFPPSIFPSSKVSILWCSAFFIVQFSHPYMTTGKTIALTRQTLVGNVCFLICCLSWS